MVSSLLHPKGFRRLVVERPRPFRDPSNRSTELVDSLIHSIAIEVIAMPATIRRTVLTFGMFALCILTPDARIFAQRGGSILESLAVEGDLSVGAELNGSLSSSDVRGPDDSYMDAWTIEGRPGESVTFDLISDDFDPFLYVIGPGFEETFSDDDSGGACYSRITLTYLESGTFRVVASSNMARQTGTYLLRVSDTPGPTAGYPCGGMNPEELLNLPTEGRTLVIGDVVAGTLASTSPTIGSEAKRAQAWSLDGTAGEAVTVTLESDAFDCYLYLTGPGLNEVLADDDGAGDLNSRITFTFPTDGIYRVVASVLSAGEGPYTILVEESIGMNELPTDGRVAEIGGTLQGRLSETDQIIEDGRRGQAWALEARAGGTYTIDLMSEDFDCFLYVIGPGLSDALTNDDGGDDLDSRLTVTTPEDGTYRIIASSLSLSGIGEYSLRVTSSER